MTVLQELLEGAERGNVRYKVNLLLSSSHIGECVCYHLNVHTLQYFRTVLILRWLTYGNACNQSPERQSVLVIVVAYQDFVFYT